MEEDWDEKFFSDLSINTIGMLVWDESNHQWAINKFNKTEPNVCCNGMVWDSTTLTWKGNDTALETFNFEA